MGNEILEQVKVAEDTIDQLKNQVKERKFMIDKERNQEIQGYREKLQNVLKELEETLDLTEGNQVDKARQALNQETDSYRQQMIDRYDQIRTDLINQGVKEVVATYGNFRNEESSDNR